MDVVAGAGEVIVQAEQHVDTHTLVRFHDVVEHIVGTVEEDDGAHREEGDEQIVHDTRREALVDEVADDGSAEEQLHPNDIEGNDKLGEQQHDERQTEAYARTGECPLLVARIDVNHRRGEQLHQQQHDELTHRRGRIPEEHLLVLNAHDEIDNHRHAREEEGAGHALPIEHQEERQIDKRRTRLSLPDDEEHRQHHDAHRREEMARVLHVEAVGTHQLRHRQCRGELCELGRLQAQRTQHQPRSRAFNLMRVEYRNKQQQQQRRIDDVSEGVVEPVVEHQQHEAQHQRRTNPDNLHAGPRGEAEDVGLAVRIAGAAHAHPAQRQ